MINIGLQLYTIRDECEKDFMSAIKKVAAIGYKGLEFAGYYGISAQVLRKVMDDLQLKAVNTHVSLRRMESDFDEEVEYAKILGMDTITIPYLELDDRMDRDSLLKTAESIAIIDQKCRDNGIQLCYHNHDFEFEKINGEYVLDILINKAKHLKLELDTFWTSYAGLDTVLYMQKKSSRLIYVHLKDMIKDEKPIFAEIGEGCLDIKSYLKTAIECGVEWVFVEQDVCTTQSIECVKKSFDNLRNLWPLCE